MAKNYTRVRYSQSTLCCVSLPNVIQWEYNTCNGKQPKTYLAVHSFAFHSFGLGGENSMRKLMGWDENREMLTSYRAKEIQLGENYFNVFPIKNQYSGRQMLRDTFSAGSWICKLEVQTADWSMGVPDKRPWPADLLRNKGPRGLCGQVIRHPRDAAAANPQTFLPLDCKDIPPWQHPIWAVILLLGCCTKIKLF